MGALAGASAAEALYDDRTTWGDRAVATFAHGEALLKGAQLPIDLAPVEALAVAVGLAGQASPLLADTATVELIDHVNALLASELPPPFGAVQLATARRVAEGAGGFADAIAAANDTDEAALIGGLYGLQHGVGAMPARLVSTITDGDGHNSRRYLARLTDRLLGIRRNDWYDPRNRRGPKQVLPGLWLSNLFGVASFVRNHPDGLVLSLCDIEGRIDDHEHQITFHLDDTPNPRPNPSLSTVIQDVLAEISKARAAGQPVLLHCRHGASRTGLILRLLLVDEQQLTATDALIEAQCVWPHVSSWNTAWNREVERRAEGNQR